MASSVKGLDEVMRNLNKEITRIKGRSLKGLIESAIVIRRSMDTSPPLVPVDWGNLDASFYTVSVLGSEHSALFNGPDAGNLRMEHDAAISEAAAKVQSIRVPAVIIGFSANYAVPVHEMTGSAGKPIKWKKAGSGPWFFRDAVSKNVKKILKTVRDNVKVKR